MNPWIDRRAQRAFGWDLGVTRRNDPASGYTGRLNSDPGLSRAEALRAITTHSAYQMGTERQTGSLERGKLADYIVLAQDPMTVRASRISETRVLRTVVGGRCPARGEPSPSLGNTSTSC